MKKQLSPGFVVIIVVLTFAAVLMGYWKGLLGKPPGKSGKMMGGASAGAVPPLVGQPEVTVLTLAGALPLTVHASDAGWVDARGIYARFDGPSAVAAGPGGVVFVTDTRNHRLRAVAPDGTVTTVAGSGPVASVMGAWADGPALSARLWNPSGLAMVGDTLYFTDTGNHRLRCLSHAGVRTVAGGETPRDRFGFPDGALADGAGAAARFRFPTGLAALPDGSLLVVDTGNRRLRRVTPEGAVSTVADLSAAGAQSPCGVAVTADGRAFVTDPAAKALFQVAGGRVSRVGGMEGGTPLWKQPTGIAATRSGRLYVVDTAAHGLVTLLPGETPVLLAGVVSTQTSQPGYMNGTGEKAAFAAPCGVAFVAPDVLYVTDYGNNCLRKVHLPPGVSE